MGSGTGFLISGLFEECLLQTAAFELICCSTHRVLCRPKACLRNHNRVQQQSCLLAQDICRSVDQQARSAAIGDSSNRV